MSAIKTAVDQSGMTVMPGSYGSELRGADQQLLAMLECFNPDKNTWSAGAQKWFKKATSSKYVLPAGYSSAIASPAASTENAGTASVAPRPQGGGGQ